MKINFSSGGELTVDYEYENNFPECFIRKYEGEFEEEMISISSIWEVEIDTNTYRGDLIKNTEHSGKFRYKLRHFLSGRVLSLGDGNVNNEKKKIPKLVDEIDLKGKIHEDSNVSFISTVADDRKIIKK